MNFNEEQLAFNSEMGLAIQQWAHVEFALAGIIYVFFSDLPSQRNAMIGFRSIENFRAKLQYLDALIWNQRIDPKHHKDWVRLQDKAAQVSKKRNRLAHYWVLNDLKGKPGRRRMLLPTRPATGPARGPRAPKYPDAIFLRDIAAYRLEFSALSTALENFCDRLSGREERLPKSLEQPSPPRTLAQLRRQIYAFANTPPRSSRG